MSLNHIPALKIEQNETTILTFTTDAKALLEIVYFDNRDKNEDGLERPCRINRSKDIADYLDNSVSAKLVNNIIVSIDLASIGLKIDDIYKNGFLDLEKLSLRDKTTSTNPVYTNKKLLHMIDGQHRLRSFEFTKSFKDPIIVTALIDITFPEAADLFVRINYYQKPVNKSMVYDLLESNKDIFPNIYTYHSVVKKLNDTINSPFYSGVKMLGEGDGFISQASLITAIDKYRLTTVLEEHEIPHDENSLYTVLWNYFSGVKKAFPLYWGKGSLLCKSVFIRAFILSIDTVLHELENRCLGFNEDDIVSILKKISIDKLLKDSEGKSGEKGVKMIAELMKKYISEGGE